MITMHTSIRAQASELWDDTQTKQVVKLSGPVKVIILNDWVRTLEDPCPSLLATLRKVGIE